MRTVRLTSPLTVEFRHALGIRKSSRVPYTGAQRPGIGKDGQCVVEPERLHGCGQLAGDGTFAGPAVDELQPGGVVAAHQPAHGHLVDTAAAHDRHRVVRHVHPVAPGEPAAQQHADGGAGAGQRDQHRLGLGVTDELGDHADRDGEAPGRTFEGGFEERDVLRRRLVFHRQHLRVMRAGLDELFALLGAALDGDLAEILQQERHVFGLVGPERGQHAVRR